VFRRSAVHLIVIAFVVTLVAVGRASPALASPVATDDGTYALYGRVFPDPHGCYVVKGTALAGKSPFAKGNVCAATFLNYDETIKGLKYLATKFPTYMEVVKVPGKSAGVPTPTLEREQSDLYAVKVTDKSATGTKKKFAFSLSIHGIERAGAEGGTRAIEDLVTWAATEPGRGLLEETLGKGASAISVGDALKQSEIWFYYPNPDGWRRGDLQPNGGLMYQRYNGNGVDPNRDWVTKGFTYRPYTPQSEPEVQAFSSFLKGLKPGFVGTGDLHGMLNANAFTYTMLPAGELDYARNQAVVAVSRRIQQDSVPRLAWFAGIQATQPSDARGVLPEVAQLWGTVWDTIAYTTTGSLGDWMGSPLGLDAYVAIDNEMWMSHLAPNNAFSQDLEQAHIDGNKGLIYAGPERQDRVRRSRAPIHERRIDRLDESLRWLPAAAGHQGGRHIADALAGRHARPHVRVRRAWPARSHLQRRADGEGHVRERAGPLAGRPRAYGRQQPHARVRGALHQG
jgi:hypothetical protein